MSTITLTRTAPAAAVASSSPRSVPVPIPTVPSPLGARQPTHLRIDDQWYDLSAWKNTHPGGPLILEQMHGKDATDAFYSLHSDEAIARLARLPHSSKLPAVLADCPPPPPTKAAAAFRVFRAKLAAEGWFTRNPLWEVFYSLSVLALAVAGTIATKYGYTWTAIMLIGFAMQQAGWIGHDYIHARGRVCHWLGYFISAGTNAFSRSWWSVKHNTHHVFTNYIGVDADIENDPVFHLFHPEEKDDTLFRKMQHWYFVPVASLLYFSWRTQSMMNAVQTNQYKELCFFLFNYIWLYNLGWQVALGSIYFGGMLVALIVTATHQSEEMVDVGAGPTADGAASVTSPSVPEHYSFCEGQFATTRDAVTSDFFTEWLWGGMQYQLEHHLFPTMPKYYYSRVAPMVKAWAQENGMDYRADTQMQIWMRNLRTLKYFAGDKAPLEQQKKAQ